MKISFKFNTNGVKNSSDMYRNIKGVFYTQATSDTSLWEKVKSEAKAKGLKTIIRCGELFIEKKYETKSSYYKISKPNKKVF